MTLSVEALASYRPVGNVVKLRICIDRYDSAGNQRVLKVLRVLRFIECA